MKLTPVIESEKEVLFKLFESYLTELNEMDDPSGFSSFESHKDLLQLYWSDKNRCPWFISDDGKEMVGFVLVNDYCEIETLLPKFSIAEFYIQPAHRKKGVGRKAAHHLFGLMKGNWEVRVHHFNTHGLVFWKKVIACYTSAFTETDIIKNGSATRVFTYAS